MPQEVRLKRCRALKQKCSMPTTSKPAIIQANREIAATMLGTEVHTHWHDGSTLCSQCGQLKFFADIMDRVMLKATRDFMQRAEVRTYYVAMCSCVNCTM